jgi:hypothetical protein
MSAGSNARSRATVRFIVIASNGTCDARSIQFVYARSSVSGRMSAAYMIWPQLRA